jgi:hypothetical protein
MASHYDEQKKCRVGTMDEAQFQRECEADSAAYFKGLLAAWTKAGGALKWGAGGVGLRGPVGGKEAGVCFLAPQFAGKKDRIELACTALAKQIGEKRVKELDGAIRKAAGEQALGSTMVSVVRPGALAAAKQRELTKAFVDLLG